MTKLKCAILLASDAQAIPTLEELETRLETKVLFGLGRTEIAQFNDISLLHIAEIRFELVQSLFSPPYAESTDDLELVVFDDTIDASLFLLTYRDIVKCLFLIDEEIAKDIFATSRRMNFLGDAADEASSVSDTVEEFIDSSVGDADFQRRLPLLKNELDAYAKGLVDAYTSAERHLKELYSSGW